MPTIPNLEFLKDTAFGELVKKLTALLSPTVYGWFSIILLSIDGVIFFIVEGMKDIPVWVLWVFGLIHVVALIISRKSTVDQAVEKAAIEDAKGNTTTASTIVNAAVEYKAAKLGVK